MKTPAFSVSHPRAFRSRSLSATLDHTQPQLWAMRCRRDGLRVFSQVSCHQGVELQVQERDRPLHCSGRGLLRMQPAVPEHDADEAQAGLFHAQRGGVQEGRPLARARAGPLRGLFHFRGRQGGSGGSARCEYSKPMASHTLEPFAPKVLMGAPGRAKLGPKSAVKV